VFKIEVVDLILTIIKRFIEGIEVKLSRCAMQAPRGEDM
jgi:hypothetical protein